MFLQKRCNTPGWNTKIISGTFRKKHTVQHGLYGCFGTREKLGCGYGWLSNSKDVQASGVLFSVYQEIGHISEALKHIEITEFKNIGS